MKKFKLLLILLSALAVVMLGIIIYIKSSIRNCDNHLRSIEHVRYIHGDADASDAVFGLYEKIKINFPDLDIQFLSREKIFANYQDVNKDNATVMAMLQELGENPFGPNIKVRIKLKDFNEIKHLENFIEKELGKVPANKIDESANLMSIQTLDPANVKSRIREDRGLLIWKIDYLDLCKNLKESGLSNQ